MRIIIFELKILIFIYIIFTLSKLRIVKLKEKNLL